jgi:predicted small secreted protein
MTKELPGTWFGEVWLLTTHFLIVSSKVAPCLTVRGWGYQTDVETERPQKSQT